MKAVEFLFWDSPVVDVLMDQSCVEILQLEERERLLIRYVLGFAVAFYDCE